MLIVFFYVSFLGMCGFLRVWFLIRNKGLILVIFVLKRVEFFILFLSLVCVFFYKKLFFVLLLLINNIIKKFFIMFLVL